MGLCASAPEEPSVHRHNQEINRQLREEAKLQRALLRMLFLGTGETGKSTMVKQLRIILGGGIGEVERRTFISTVYLNVLSNSVELIQCCRKLEIDLPPDLDAVAKQLFNAYTSGVRENQLDIETAMIIERLWKSEAFQTAYSHRSQFGLPDATEYLMTHVLRFAEKDFMPTEEDIIHLRQRTSGISEYQFPLTSRTNLVVIDVGGQRAERRKWLHCFMGVTAVVFFVALNDYDLTLREDPTVNRMHESMIVFREITTGPWFKDINKILFLNKKDLFKQKILTSSLLSCFPDYTGPQTYEAGLKFIQTTFQSICPNQTLFIHVTCATSRKNVEFVFNSIKTILLDQSLGTL